MCWTTDTSFNCDVREVHAWLKSTSNTFSSFEYIATTTRVYKDILTHNEDGYLTVPVSPLATDYDSKNGGNKFIVI